MKIKRFLAVCVLAFIPFLSMQMLVQAAEVIYVKGNVQVQSPSDNEWKKAEKGMLLAVGDMIRTARSSMAEVALDAEKKNAIRIEPKTTVILNSATADTVDRLDLAKGKVYANLENIKAGLSFEINTPSAVAGVRGSALSVYVESDSDEIVAFKDTVFIRAYNADKKLISEVMLPEGFKTMVERFGEPSMFYQINRKEFRRFDNTMEDLFSDIEGLMRVSDRVEEDRRDVTDGENMDQPVERKNITDGLSDITQQSAEDSKVQERLDEISEEGHQDPWQDPYYCEMNPQAPECN